MAKTVDEQVSPDASLFSNPRACLGLKYGFSYLREQMNWVKTDKALIFIWHQKNIRRYKSIQTYKSMNDKNVIWHHV